MLHKSSGLHKTSPSHGFLWRFSCQTAHCSLFTVNCCKIEDYRLNNTRCSSITPCWPCTLISSVTEKSFFENIFCCYYKYQVHRSVKYHSQQRKITLNKTIIYSIYQKKSTQIRVNTPKINYAFSRSPKNPQLDGFLSNA